jgi:hypothetical protein
MSSTFGQSEMAQAASRSAQVRGFGVKVGVKVGVVEAQARVAERMSRNAISLR